MSLNKDWSQTMHYNIHENGWTVISDFDLRTCTQEDVNKIAKLIATNTCVVFRNQKLEIEDELRVLKMFKNPEPLIPKGDEYFDDFVSDPVKDPTGIICRVTAELRDGKEGLAGWEEDFDWHCNMPEVPTRRPIVWLHGIKGTEGSRTSWNNNILSYEGLPEDVKAKIANLHSIYGNISAPEAYGYSGVEYNYDWTPSLVQTNIAKKVSMYFSPMQIGKFVELSQEESDELKAYLFKHILQDKYVYHHDWKDGDVVISEQWTGIHKRWAFSKMNERLLHRAVVDFPDQDYTS